MSDRDGEVGKEDETGGAVAEGADVEASSEISSLLVPVITGWPLEGAGSALRSGTRLGTSGETPSASLKRGGLGQKREEVGLRI